MRILTSIEDIVEVCDSLQATLNGVHEITLKQAYKNATDREHNAYIIEKYGEGNHVAILNHKNEPITIVSIENINKAFNKKYLFIPNAMGVLKKNMHKEIISPTTYYLASKLGSNGNDLEYARFILGGMLDHNYSPNNNDETIYSYNNKFLIIKQTELITWKMREEYIKKYNSDLYEAFKITTEGNNTYGKNGNRPPSPEDFVAWFHANKSTIKGAYKSDELLTPKYIKYFVSIDTLKANLTNNPLLKGKQISINESISGLLSD